MIKNTVTSKAIVSIDLADYFPADDSCAYIDLKDYLFKGLLLRESEFRERMEGMEWSIYQDQYVGLYCTADAIVPMWAYMILATHLSAYASVVLFGKKEQFPLLFLHHQLENMDTTNFEGKRLVIKGCGDKLIDEHAFTIASTKLAKVARAISYGEPCSTVPVYKRNVD